jgi:large subunit ribosomal protein L23
MITLIPRISEKTYALAQQDTYVFNVPMTANKQQVIAAVTEQYGVKVKDVRTIVVKGKPVRATRGKRQNPGRTTRTDVKKVYVTLSEGSIEMFKQAEEA